MAPLNQAIRVERRVDSDCVYTGTVDEEWSVGVVPNGGYILALIIQACITHQSTTTLPSPLHVSAHYLQPTQPAPFEVHIRIIKPGRNFINIHAELMQAGRTCVLTHLIFGNVPPRVGLGPLVPVNSGFARPYPLSAFHPSSVNLPGGLTALPPGYQFEDQMHWAEDPAIRVLNHTPHANGGFARWGAWIELTDKDTVITTASLALIADTTLSMGFLYPTHVTGAVEGDTWLPTLTLSIEYKAPIPASGRYSKRTVGVYVRSGYLSEPQGRHNTIVEIWTAPADIGDGGEVRKGWADEQVCLAVATQMG
ncbi:thioesterase-like superfamily-domain-containing protein [Roridomyces roridus]|uniref:Thioesterase-like superfamily-domain-containing protein n=1 Tax=Roridomyces roridus TaxID=1738132 RepID=A0AAD7B655_9AGAR|nr:thioesterase-like superfamily-domain-containing protein [Roridomyces roridus]